MEKAKRGFAAMTPERRREIASLGGKATSPENRAFSLNRQLASEAAKKRFKKEPANDTN